MFSTKVAHNFPSGPFHSAAAFHGSLQTSLSGPESFPVALSILWPISMVPCKNFSVAPKVSQWPFTFCGLFPWLTAKFSQWPRKFPSGPFHSVAHFHGFLQKFLGGPENFPVALSNGWPLTMAPCKIFLVAPEISRWPRIPREWPFLAKQWPF